MYSENTDDNKKSEKPFEPTPIELRKQYNTLDTIIRSRSTKLKEESKSDVNAESDSEDDNGYLPPYNSAF